MGETTQTHCQSLLTWLQNMPSHHADGWSGKFSFPHPPFLHVNVSQHDQGPFVQSPGGSSLNSGDCLAIYFSSFVLPEFWAIKICYLIFYFPVYIHLWAYVQFNMEDCKWKSKHLDVSMSLCSHYSIFFMLYCVNEQTLCISYSAHNSMKLAARIAPKFNWEPVSDWTSTCIPELLQITSLAVSEILICKTSVRHTFIFSACRWVGLDREIIAYTYKCIFVLSKHMLNLKMLRVLVWISNEKPKGVKSNEGAKMLAEVRIWRNLKKKILLYLCKKRKKRHSVI